MNVYLLYGLTVYDDSPVELLGVYSSEDAAMAAWHKAHEDGGVAWSVYSNGFKARAWEDFDIEAWVLDAAVGTHKW